MSHTRTISEVYAAAAEARSSAVEEILSSEGTSNSNLSDADIGFIKLAASQSLTRESRAIDPATIELILTGITLLASLFGGDDNEEVAAWIARVETQLYQMNQLLSDILNALRNLGVYIDSRFDLDAEADILSRVDTYVDNVEAWKRTLDSAQTVSDMSNLCLALQQANRKVMYYGYAGVYSVCLGMRAEADLLTLLNRDNTSKRRAYERFKGYFGDCIDESKSGNLVNTLRGIQAQIAGHQQAFPNQNGQGSFIDPPRWYRQNVNVLVAFLWRQHFVRHITGSLSAGFTGEARDEGHKYNDSDHGDYLPSYDAALADAKAQIAREVARLNDASNHYRLLRIRERCISEGIDGARRFGEVANTLLTTIP